MPAVGEQFEIVEGKIRIVVCQIGIPLGCADVREQAPACGHGIGKVELCRVGHLSLTAASPEVKHVLAPYPAPFLRNGDLEDLRGTGAAGSFP